MAKEPPRWHPEHVTALTFWPIMVGVNETVLPPAMMIGTLHGNTLDALPQSLDFQVVVLAFPTA